MAEDLRIEYTYYPRRHYDEIPQSSHQGVVHEVTRIGDAIVAQVAVGELSHQRLFRRCADIEQIDYLEIGLPSGFAYPKLLAVGAWPRQISRDDRAWVASGLKGEAAPGIDARPAEDLLRQVGFGLLAATKLSLSNEAACGDHEYDGVATPADITEIEAAEEARLVIFYG